MAVLFTEVVWMEIVLSWTDVGGGLKPGGGFFVSGGRHFQMLMDGANKVEVGLKMLIVPNSCK